MPDGLGAPAGESPGEFLRKDLCDMPRQRIHHSRVACVFPEDFPQRLERFNVQSLQAPTRKQAYKLRAVLPTHRPTTTRMSRT